MADIDAALENGPVLAKFGSESCYWCVQMIPVLDELSILYPGITVMDVDVDANREFIKPFYISSIPQIDIIVRKNPDGTYLYVDNGGKPSDGILKSRIVGYLDAAALKKPLDAALALRNSS
jgi:thiol-disulfide isomerase/thioredoxin